MIGDADVRGTASPEPDVTLLGITKRFGDIVAVDDISLDIEPGEFLALLGPSGCGKTTTLRMVAGFEEPTAGEIIIGGRNAVGIPPHKRDVNTVFQQYALFPHMSVLENVAYGLKQRKLPRQERRRKAMEALELVRLPERAAARPAQLSGGQQQRVALARALVMRPKVLLLDEPLGALDLKLRKAMQIELKTIQNEVGITFVVVTHDQEEAMSMADRIAVMNEGRIDQLGSPSEIYDHPATPFVADFIGDMNHLQGTLEKSAAGDLAVALPGGRAGVAKVVSAAQPGSRVRVGVRPEEVRARMRGDGESATTLTAMVLGHHVQLVARLADGTEVVARQRRVDADAGLAELHRGDPVWIEWPAAAALLLGPVNGSTPMSAGIQPVESEA
jgi:spermidine/putrescine ABC transporter ATP-binding subunit